MIRRYDGNSQSSVEEPHSINPGRIPSGFRQTYALECESIDELRLTFDILEIAWDKGDSISILDHNGNLLKRFTSLKQINQDSIKIPPHFAKQKTNRQRLYLILKTVECYSADPNYHYSGRKANLRKIVAVNCSAKSPKAYIIGDDIDYESTNGFCDAYYFDPFLQKEEPLFPPWSADTVHSPSGQRRCRNPKEEVGWFLIGKNVQKAEKGFYELIYYNEISSKLRFYLFNISLSQDVSLFNIEVGLRGKIGGENNAYQELNGAIFQADPNPRNWSRANITIGNWGPAEWISFDIPILYPMIEKLPISGVPIYNSYTPHPGSIIKRNQFYISLYEEELKNNFSNISIYTKIRGYTTASYEGDFIGKAIGEAIQSLNKNDPYAFTNLAKSVWDGISSGYSYYDKTNKFYEEIDKYYEKNKSGFKAAALKLLLDLGAGAWSGPLAAVGFAASILDSALFSTPEPMTLALYLSVSGAFTGKSISPAMATEWWFYLPARFCVEEAFATTGFPSTDLAQVDARLPLYDRPMGLFGFQYDPGYVELRAYAQAFIDRNYDFSLSYFVFPATHAFDPAKFEQTSILKPPRYELEALQVLCNEYPGADIYIGERKIDCNEIKTILQKDLFFRFNVYDCFGKASISEVLPIVYNPYAGIQPVTSIRSPQGGCGDYQYSEPHGECGYLEVRAFPAGPDAILECNGVRLYFCPVGSSGTDLEVYRVAKDPKVNGKLGFCLQIYVDPGDVNGSIAAVEYANFLKSGRPAQEYYVAPTSAAGGYVGNWYNMWLGPTFRIGHKDPFPLLDLVMTWEMKYWAKPRDENARPLLKTIVLQSPITFKVEWSPACPTNDATAFKSCYDGGAAILEIESELLRKTGNAYPTNP
jgi:hypothetical protein